MNQIDERGPIAEVDREDHGEFIFVFTQDGLPSPGKFWQVLNEQPSILWKLHREEKRLSK